MLFKVTHIDEAGHRHRARVTARNLTDALEQVDRQWGAARRLVCMRMASRPVLHVVPPSPDLPDHEQEGLRCAC